MFEVLVRKDLDLMTKIMNTEVYKIWKAAGMNELIETLRQSDQHSTDRPNCPRYHTNLESKQSEVSLTHATNPTVVMVINDHQNPSPAPLMNDRGKSSWLVGESYKNTTNKAREKKKYC